MTTTASGKHLLLSPCLLTLILGLSSCNQNTDQSSDTEQLADQQQQLVVEAQHDEIHWFEGSIDQAFAQAETDQKPLFFYWGAIWCPPCEQIKATVFKHPAFLAKSSLFIPVYLDGDTERAQSWGEKFAVAGYPTMIVFSPAGEEITRIPGWIDSEQYLNVLQLALDDSTSTTALLAKALANPVEVPADAYTRLAYYSWDQANLPEETSMDSATFRFLADAAQDAGNPVAWSRMTFHYLYNLLQEADEDTAPEMSATDKKQAWESISRILDNPELVLANSDYLMFYFEEVITLLNDNENDRANMANQWFASMQAIRDASQLSGAEHIASWYPQIQWYWMEHTEAVQLPVEMEQALLAYIDDIDNATRGKARQNVIHTAYQVLQMAKRNDLARTMLLAELEKSHAPYYFMSSLGDLEEEEGNTTLALDWHRRAWEGADGEATRFQWGYQYVDSLVRLSPDQGNLILDTSKHLLSEFSDQQNLLTGRNFARLKRLLGSLQEWHDNATLSDENQAGLHDMLSGLTSLCTESTEDFSEQCQALQTSGLVTLNL